eukprot:2277063-Prymnesium_polylepis.1
MVHARPIPPVYRDSGRILWTGTEFSAAFSMSQRAMLRIGLPLLAYHWDGPEVLTAPSTPVNSE